MKSVKQPYRNLILLIAGAALIFLAVILSGLFPQTPFFRTYFPFSGTLLVLAANWLMYRTEGKNLTALGLGITRNNIRFLIYGLFLGNLAFAGGYYLKTLVTGEHWHFNRTIDIQAVLQSLYWILPAAAVQQLMIRGYCFTKLVEMTNSLYAILISGLIFIGMHDFWNGGVVQIIAYASSLFIGHVLFSVALLRSGTLYLAIGLHWGNNLANSTLFTEGRKDSSLLFTTDAPVGFMGLVQFSLMFLAINLGFILLILLFRFWKQKP